MHRREVVLRPDVATDIHGGSLKPYLNFTAVRVTSEGIRQAGTEFPTRGDGTPGALDCCDGGVNILRPRKAKPKVNDAAGGTGAGGTFLKRKNIVLPGPQDLHHRFTAKIFAHPKDGAIERK